MDKGIRAKAPTGGAAPHLTETNDASAIGVWQVPWNKRRMKLRLVIFALSLVGLACAASASILKVSAGSTSRAPAEVEADYTTSHLYIDEVAQESVPITLFFDPQTLGVEVAEVLTNLNRREWAQRDADQDGIEDGIRPPNHDTVAPFATTSYYRAHQMVPVSGGIS